MNFKSIIDNFESDALFEKKILAKFYYYKYLLRYTFITEENFIKRLVVDNSYELTIPAPAISQKKKYKKLSLGRSIELKNFCFRKKRAASPYSYTLLAQTHASSIFLKKKNIKNLIKCLLTFEINFNKLKYVFYLKLQNFLNKILKLKKKIIVKKKIYIFNLSNYFVFFTPVKKGYQARSLWGTVGFLYKLQFDIERAVSLKKSVKKKLKNIHEIRSTNVPFLLKKYFSAASCFKKSKRKFSYKKISISGKSRQMPFFSMHILFKKKFERKKKRKKKKLTKKYFLNYKPGSPNLQFPKSEKLVKKLNKLKKIKIINKKKAMFHKKKQKKLYNIIKNFKN